MSKAQNKIKFNDLDIYNLKFNNQIIIDFKKNLKQNNFIFGESVSRLETKLVNYTGSKYVSTVASGTDAILLSLLSLGLKEGDEIIIPSFSWLSVVEMVLLIKCKPVYVDTSIDTFNLIEDQLENKITKKTKAVISTSLFGRSVDLIKLKKLCKKKKLILIEDAAQNFGSIINEKSSCNIADLTITSFFPSKTMGCYGDGGAVFTNNLSLYRKIFQLRNHGQKSYSIGNMVGINSRLGSIQASILLEKLKKIDFKIESQRNFYLKFQKFFLENNIEGFPKFRNKKYRDSHGQFSIIVRNRDKLINKLNINKIPFKIYYPLPLYKQFKQKNSINLKNTEFLCNHIISLPHNDIDDLRFKKIKRIFKKIIKSDRKIFFEKK